MIRQLGLVLHSNAKAITITARAEILMTSRKSTISQRSSSNLYDSILSGLNDKADPRTRAWFTNYVKGTTWIGCKTPVVRSVIKDVLNESSSQSGRKRKVTSTDTVVETAGTTAHATPDEVMSCAINLLSHNACDAKMAGILLLSENYPPQDLATMSTLDRPDNEIWNSAAIDDWSTADWFSTKVLSKIVFTNDTDVQDNDKNRHALQKRVLDYTRRPGNSLWHRRCGIVPFLQYHQKRDYCIPNIGTEIIKACEDNLLASPDERFTQTGIAWVIRYVLELKKTHPDGKEALDFVVRHGSVWTKEAKKSFCEKLPKSDPWRKKIMALE